jgi:hypothetical protein
MQAIPAPSAAAKQFRLSANWAQIFIFLVRATPPTLNHYLRTTDVKQISPPILVNCAVFFNSCGNYCGL